MKFKLRFLQFYCIHIAIYPVSGRPNIGSLVENGLLVFTCIGIGQSVLRSGALDKFSQRGVDCFPWGYCWAT